VKADEDTDYIYWDEEVIFNVLVKFMDRVAVISMDRSMVRIMECFAMKIPILYTGGLNSDSSSWSFSWSRAWSWSWARTESGSWSRAWSWSLTGRGGIP